MNIFELFLNPEDEDANGVYAMSIVGRPAMKSNYVALSDGDIMLKVQDEKKKILTGVALIPNKLITRYNEDTKEHYQIYFSEDTIEKTSQQFLKNFNQNNVTVEHMLSVDDVTVVESWIKTDDKLDKSVALGIEAPVGSWLMTLKVDDNELWDGLIETGLLNGFSIEGKFESKQVSSQELSEINENRKYMKDTNKSFITMLREVVLGKDTVEVEGAAVAEVSKWWMDLVDGSTFELGDQLMRKPSMDGGEPTQLGAGEYELEDGRKILTDSEGIIRYIFGDAPAEPAPAEPATTEAVQASEVVEPVETEATVETPAETPAVAETETPAVETPAVETPAVAEVIEKIEKENEPQMIPITDAEVPARAKKVKFNNKLTVQERIKQGLGTLD